MKITYKNQLFYETGFEHGRKIIKVRRLLTVEDLMRICKTEFYKIPMSKIDIHPRISGVDSYTEIHVKHEDEESST